MKRKLPTFPKLTPKQKRRVLDEVAAIAEAEELRPVSEDARHLASDDWYRVWDY